jgi:hypothetical protein
MESKIVYIPHELAERGEFYHPLPLPDDISSFNFCHPCAVTPNAHKIVMKKANPVLFEGICEKCNIIFRSHIEERQ